MFVLAGITHSWVTNEGPGDANLHLFEVAVISISLTLKSPEQKESGSHGNSSENNEMRPTHC